MDPNMAVAIRDMQLDQLCFEHPLTLKLLDNAPEDKLAWRPHETSRPFHELLHHVFASSAWFASIVEDGKVSFDEPPKVVVPTTRAALRAECEKAAEGYIARVKAIAPAKLAAMIPFGPGPAMPAVNYLGWYHSHLVHHRGQLSVYLRLMGAKVPSIYGGSADEPFSM